jgi:hypothetical protein
MRYVNCCRGSDILAQIDILITINTCMESRDAGVTHAQIEII